MRTLILLLIAAWALPASAQTLVLIRHAEKLEPWPGPDALQPLSAEGMARADAWAVHFRGTRFAAIYSSATTRTISTVRPLAIERRQRPLPHAAGADVSAIAAWREAELPKFAATDTVLIASHSNIIPGWLRAFGLADSVATTMGIAHDARYGDLLVQGYEGTWTITLRSDAAPDITYRAVTTR